MNAIIPLSSGQLPAYLTNKTAVALSINDDVVRTGHDYPVMSIKGKVFTLVKGGERKILTRADDPDEVLQNIEVVTLRANTKSRVYYANAYVEGAEGDSARPDCYTNDGTAPAADSRNPQNSKCATCPHAVWGTGNDGKGTACTVNTRLAVVDPGQLNANPGDADPVLLRLPAGSRSNFAEVVKTANNRGIPYNALVLKIGFDREAPAPKLTFRIMGLLSDSAYANSSTLYDNETVRHIVGTATVEAAQPSESSGVDRDLDAALAAKAESHAEAKPAKAESHAEAKPAKVDPGVAILTQAKNGQYQALVDALSQAFGEARMEIWSEDCIDSDQPWGSAADTATLLNAALTARVPAKGWNADQQEALALAKRASALPALSAGDTPAETEVEVEAEVKPKATRTRKKPVEETPVPVPTPEPAATVTANQSPISGGLLDDLDALLNSTDD